MTFATRFSSLQDITELVPESLWIPGDRQDLWPPHAAEHSSETTTPREVGHIFYAGMLACFSVERSILDLKKQEQTSTVELFTGGWGNHMGRTLLRVVLDPQRLAPVDMVAAYNREVLLERSVNEDERNFFKDFIKNYGIAPR
jgi:hypothetical protein